MQKISLMINMQFKPWASHTFVEYVGSSASSLWCLNADKSLFIYLIMKNDLHADSILQEHPEEQLFEQLAMLEVDVEGDKLELGPLLISDMLAVNRL